MDMFGRLARWLDRRSEGVRGRSGLLGNREPYPAAATPVPAPRELVARRRDSGDAVPAVHADGPLPETAFALALYDRLRERPGNLCFSPLSIRIALALVCEGARGETARQMRQVLGLPAEGALALASMATLQARLGASGTVSVASSLWLQEGVTLRQDYLDSLSGAVDCGIGFVDFVAAPAASTNRINGWVRDRTQGRIDRLVAPSSFTSLTRLVLANAVFFHGEWRDPFDPTSTRHEAFHLAGGGRVAVPLMRRIITAPYFESDGLQGLVLPYESTSLQLTVFLPSGADGLLALERRLSPQAIASWLRLAEPRKVRVILPRFTVSADVDDLVEQCSALGMLLPFTAAADFSGINGHPPGEVESLHIGDVLHRATIEVDERGTTAAAATVFDEVMTAAAPGVTHPIPEFRADRPFLFAIRDNASGTLVFLGRVVGPLE